MVGLELDRPAEGGDRLVEPARRVQGDAQVVVGLGMIGLERDRTAVGGDRLVEPAGLVQGDAQVVVRLGIIGLAAAIARR